MQIIYNNCMKDFLLNIKKQTIENNKRTFRPNGFSIDPKVYSQAFENVKLYPSILGVKAFLNICPHRGATMKLKGDIFQCPYHGWKFNADNGDLIATTGPKCPYKNLKLKKNHGIHLGGVYFNTIAKSNFIDEIEFLTQSKYFSESEFPIKANWKFVVESLLETYHFQFAHERLLKGFENSFFSYERIEGDNASITIALDSFKEYFESNDINGINIMYFIFPRTFLLVLQGGHVWFSIDFENEKESILKLYFFGNEMIKTTLESLIIEDVEIIETQQRNLQHIDRFLFTGHENLIQKFHDDLKSISKTNT